MTLPLVLAAAGGAVLVAVFLLAAVRPSLLARLYGVPVDGAAPRAWVRAAGLRDACLGIVLVGTSCLGDLRGAQLCCVAAVVLALGDFALAFLAGGRKLRLAHANHAAGAVAFVVLLVLLLRR